ncbi:MAG TPA: four helix bundle protein [Flavisolibacter sp.]|nr:four helix bundle protein [Flavisolibacter sp.]
MQKFEDLEVWQLARALCQKINPLTFELPVAKGFHYKDQVRGPCGSIMDNIAEGSGRGSKLELINALTIVKGEAEERKSQLYRGLDVHYFSASLFNELYNLADLIIKKIGAFISYLNKSKMKGQKLNERI